MADLRLCALVYSLTRIYHVEAVLIRRLVLLRIPKIENEVHRIGMEENEQPAQDGDLQRGACVLFDIDIVVDLQRHSKVFRVTAEVAAEFRSTARAVCEHRKD